MLTPPFSVARTVLAMAALAIWAAAYALDGVWWGDFWSHAAVVGELSNHLTAPSHPQLAVDVPHAFFSPYAWVVALGAKLAGAGPIAALSVAGVLNVLLWGCALWAFCRSRFAEHGTATAFWSLLLILFWWGDGEWFWSGFLHAGVFGYVAPYPATFALVATLFAFVLAQRWIEGSWSSLAAVVLLLAVILITHPVTAVFTIVGLGAIGFERFALGRGFWVLAAATVVAVLLALAWPLYPFASLWATENQEFHMRSRDLYEDLWARTYPVVLALPWVLLRLRARPRDMLAWTIVGLLLVYAAGYFTRWYGLGRVVSPLAIFVQIGLARELVRLEQTFRTSRAKLMGAVVALALVVSFVAKSDGPLRRVFERHANNHVRFHFLAELTGADDVVMADLVTSWYLPAFGPRIVACEKPVYWVNDHEQRRLDVDRFFATSDAVERRRILNHYDVTCVLFETEDPARNSLASLGRVIHDDGFLTLVRLGP